MSTREHCQHDQAKVRRQRKSQERTGPKNEVYAKFVAHNICVLIQEMYVQGIDPKFGKNDEREIEEDGPRILRFPA
jgi:hypothetical protein